MYCRNCGKEMDENDKFCKECGTNAIGELNKIHETSKSIDIKKMNMKYVAFILSGLSFIFLLLKWISVPAAQIFGGYGVESKYTLLQILDFTNSLYNNVNNHNMDGLKIFATVFFGITILTLVCHIIFCFALFINQNKSVYIGRAAFIMSIILPVSIFSFIMLLNNYVKSESKGLISTVIELTPFPYIVALAGVAGLFILGSFTYEKKSEEINPNQKLGLKCKRFLFAGILSLASAMLGTMEFNTITITFITSLLILAIFIFVKQLMNGRYELHNADFSTVFIMIVAGLGALRPVIVNPLYIYSINMLLGIGFVILGVNLISVIKKYQSITLLLVDLSSFLMGGGLFITSILSLLNILSYKRFLFQTALSFRYLFSFPELLFYIALSIAFFETYNADLPLKHELNGDISQQV